MRIEKIGDRWYLRGNSYPVRETIKAAGGKWDSGRRGWWFGEKAVAEEIVVRLACAEQSSGTPAESMPRDGNVYAGAKGGVRHSRGNNRKSGYCEHCGSFLKPGEGRLEYCIEDSGCPKHHDFSGYHLYCAASAECDSRKRAAREQAHREADALKAALAATTGIAQLGSEAKASPPWWSQAIEPIAIWSRPVMVHTAAYPEVFLLGNELYYHVPGYFACDWDYPAVHRIATLTDEQKQIVISAIEQGRKAGLIRPEVRHD